MEAAAVPMPGGFSNELRNLFYQRTLICLWMGVVFFSLFSLLDFICWPKYYHLFLSYRLSLVLIYLIMLGLLRYERFKPFAPPIMFSALLLGTLTISLMTAKLGGFVSGYFQFSPSMSPRPWS